MYAKVIIEYGVKSLDKVFIYKVPNRLVDILSIGMKVLVPFGSQEVMGFVLEIINEISDNSYDIKEIKEIVDEEIILNEELLDLGKYLKDATMCSLITAYQTMLPTGLKIKNGKRINELFVNYIDIKNKDKAIKYIDEYKLKRKAQVKVLEKLLENGKILKSEISKNIIDSLIENDIVEVIGVKKNRIEVNNKIITKSLTDDQMKVFESVDINTYNPYLLYGVTGSGKTEVYIKLIEKVIKNDKRAIMLVPEISLTTQITKRFYEAFGDDVAILHSALSNGEKYDEYLKIFRGEVHVVVGTRSAIFAPLKDLGIIIIDEEDSNSYKQDNNPRYHAKDIALYRAKYNNIPLVLGSATPSLESMARAKKNVYKLLELKKRVGNAVMPKIYIIDMEAEMKKRNMIFSNLLKEKIKEKLEKKEQIILFLNRRGFSTFINCSNCGFTYKCPSCDISLTYHKTSNNLICHYCGYQQKKDLNCPKCGEDALNYFGLGTEKLEEKLKDLFPDARIVRMDQDTTRKKGAHEKIITDFKNEKYDILLGTQMISKGLDFPKVTLVGVINADTTLNIPDYRSSENTFSLLSQVAGRSGRSDIPGEVIIQTFNPDNYVIKCASLNDYDKFFNYEMDFRHKLSYPPYFYLVGIKVIGASYDETINNSKLVKDYLLNKLSSNFKILGPTTASVFKFNNEYRMQLIIKYKFEENLMSILKELDEIFVTNKQVRLEFDFNPIKI